MQGSLIHASTKSADALTAYHFIWTHQVAPHMLEDRDWGVIARGVVADDILSLGTRLGIDFCVSDF